MRNRENTNQIIKPIFPGYIKKRPGGEVSWCENGITMPYMSSNLCNCPPSHWPLQRVLTAVPGPPRAGDPGGAGPPDQPRHRDAGGPGARGKAGQPGHHGRQHGGHRQCHPQRRVQLPRGPRGGPHCAQVTMELVT